MSEKIIPDDLDIRVLFCIRERRLTEIEVKKRFGQLYPPCLVITGPLSWNTKREDTVYILKYRKFDAQKVIASAITGGFLDMEEIVEESGSVTRRFFITSLGRGLITPEKKKKE